MQQLQQSLFAPVYEKAKAAVEKLGTEGGFTYIIDLSAGSLIFKGADSIDLLPLAKKELGIPESKTKPTQLQLPAQQPAE
jgi:outer membrane protein